jgi:hypothetical protein
MWSRIKTELRSANTDPGVFFYAPYHLCESVWVYYRVVIQQPNVVMIIAIENVTET